MTEPDPATPDYRLAQARQVQLLDRPDSYPEQTSAVERRETHLSWVFLTDRFVYKLKKAVRYEFVDFSALHARRQACDAELELNRRLTDGVYLEVLPITRHADGGLQLGGAGTAIDWVVKMRRLPAGRMLDVLIESRQVDPSDVELLAQKLAGFLQTAAPVEISAADYIRGLEGRIIGNYQQLRAPDVALNSTLMMRIHGAQLRTLHVGFDWFASRIHGQRLIDGHGDLRPEHICLERPPQIFDCIEFRADFRRIDPADELGFLAMECEALGDVTIGQQILDDYCRAADDRFPEALLKFHKSYRACVRAKVSALRSAQLGQPHDRETIDRYMALADTYVASLPPPLLLVVTGISGSGKSTLAEALAARLAAQWLQTDALRRAMFGPPNDESAVDRGRYSPENRQRVYQQMMAAAENCLASRLNVILDGTFASAEHVAQATRMAQQYGAKCMIVECRCPAELALARIRKRATEAGRLSDATAEVLEQQLHDQRRPAGAVLVDTMQPLAAQQSAVLDRLRVA